MQKDKIRTLIGPARTHSNIANESSLHDIVQSLHLDQVSPLWHVSHRVKAKIAYRFFDRGVVIEPVT